jgi:hypothetical protein
MYIKVPMPYVNTLQCVQRAGPRINFPFVVPKVDCWAKRTQGLFRTFEDFEFSKRKNPFAVERACIV